MMPLSLEGTMADVLCFGNLQFDVLCRPVASLPAPGELRPIDHIDFALSGNGGNVAMALARLGIAVDLAGYSGADAVGESFRRTLAAQGVGLRALLRHPTASTGTSVIAVSPSGERTVMFVNGSNRCFDLDIVPDAWLEGVRVVSVGSLFVLPLFTQDALASLFQRAHDHGAVTMLNICPVPHATNLDALTKVLSVTDYFVLSQHEGRQLVGTDEPERILEVLDARTRGRVILTLAERGCCLRLGESFDYIPAETVEAVDCTGAGDAFVAGLIAGIVTGRRVAEAARLGCTVASFAVTGPGAYPRIPALSQMEHSLSRQWQMTGEAHARE
jgi:ribokinase